MKSVQVQLTTFCNERCVFCRKYEWKKKHISIDVLEEKIKKYQFATFQFSGGEPLLYSNLKKLNDLIAKYNIKYKVYSNMSMDLNDEQEEFLDNAFEIAVSLDSITSEGYNKIRQPLDEGAFDNVIFNMLTYSDKVKTSTVVMNGNFEEVTSIALFCSSREIKSRFYKIHTNLETSLTFQEEMVLRMDIESLTRNKVSDTLRRLSNIFNYFDEENNKFVECNVRNHHRVIDEDGREYTCCYAINDNGEDIDGVNALPNDDLLDIHEEYTFCDICSRYKKSNENWDELKDKEGIFL